MRGQSAFASAPILGAERKRKSGDKQLSRQDDATGRPAAVERKEGGARTRSGVGFRAGEQSGRNCCRFD